MYFLFLLSNWPWDYWIPHSIEKSHMQGQCNNFLELFFISKYFENKSRFFFKKDWMDFVVFSLRMSVGCPTIVISRKISYSRSLQYKIIYENPIVIAFMVRSPFNLSKYDFFTFGVGSITLNRCLKHLRKIQWFLHQI